MKYRKKPIIVDAWLFTADLDVSQFEGVSHCAGTHGHVETLEGRMTISRGDYLVRGVKGEYYACKPDIFEMNHDVAE